VFFELNTAAFPDSPQSSYNLGFLYERIRNLEAALKYYETAYEKALKANPQTSGFYKMQADRLKNRLPKKQ